MIEIADAADMIVRGYAFTRKNGHISILNLNRPTHAMIINHDGKMLESSMDPIEQTLVLKIWESDSEFMEDEDKVAGYYLYYTKHCIIECMHAHASDKRLTETGSAKLFVKSEGSTVVQNQGTLTDIQLRKIQKYIKKHYLVFYSIYLQIVFPQKNTSRITPESVLFYYEIFLITNFSASMSSPVYSTKAP